MATVGSLSMFGAQTKPWLSPSLSGAIALAVSLSPTQGFRTETSEIAQVSQSSNVSSLSMSNPAMAGSRVSTSQLLRHSVSQLEDLTRAFPETFSSAVDTRFILGRVLSDNGPTPQIARSEEGYVETRWLVGNDFLTLTSLDSGVFEVTFMRGSEIIRDFDFEVNDGAASTVAIRDIQAILREMSKNIQNRLLISA